MTIRILLARDHTVVRKGLGTFLKGYRYRSGNALAFTVCEVLVRSLFSYKLPASLRGEMFHVNVVLEHHLPVPGSISLERVFM